MSKILKMKLLSMICVLFMFLNCGTSGSKETDDSYIKQIRLWQKQRLERLKAPDSWLSLAGLFWLEEGENTFGGDSDNDFIIHIEGLPEHIGVFILKKGIVKFRADNTVDVYHNNKPVKEIVLENDSSSKPTILKFHSLSWFVVKRGNRLGIRLKDAKHPRMKQLKKIEMFPIDSGWRIKAVFEKFENPRIIKTPTVLGYLEEQPCPGVLVFRFRGKSFRLFPFEEDRDFFLVFGDLTNTHETYGGGRFLVVEKPDKNGMCWIDFNKSYNPPCVFSPYATCPLPPEENRLPIRITAGELMVKGFGH
jgi:uncharacterized protein (DUF1684 family)